MTTNSNDAYAAPIGAFLPAVAVRRPYSTPALTRFGLVRNLTQKDGASTDGTFANKKT